jgi:hypothetical protein
VDTTSFSVHGDDAATQVIAAEGEEGAPDVEADPALLPIMSGSSRDHREDLTL